MRGHVFRAAGVTIYVLPFAVEPVLVARPGLVSLTRRATAAETRAAIERGIAAMT